MAHRLGGEHLKASDSLTGPPSTSPQTGAPWTLKQYIVWRVLGAFVIALVVLTSVFVAMQVVASEPLWFRYPRGGCVGNGTAAGGGCGSYQDVFYAQWGLREPLPERYLIFLQNVLGGKLGVAVLPGGSGVPVWTVIAPALAPLLELAGILVLLVAVVAVGVGLPLGKRRGSAIDEVASILLAIPFSATTPVLSLLAFYLLFPFFSTTSLPSQSYAQLSLYALVVVLALIGVAGLFVWGVRDYPMHPPIRTPPKEEDGRSTPGPGVGWMRPAFARFLAAMPPFFAWTIGAILLTEVVWNKRNLGFLLWSSVQNQDPLVIMGILLVLGLLVVLPVITAADILHEWLSTGWVRRDGVTVEDFSVHPHDLWMGIRRVFTRAPGFVGTALALVLVCMAALAPVLVGPYQTALNLAAPYLPPSSQHPLGTNGWGLDELNRLLYGAIPMIPVALFALAIASIAGLGAVAVVGFLGPRAETFALILVDAGLVLPIPGVALFSYMWAGSLKTWGILLPGLVAWPLTTRIILLEARGLVSSRTGFRNDGLAKRCRRTLNLVWGAGPLIAGNAFVSLSLALSVSVVLDFYGLGASRFGVILSWGQLVTLSYFDLDVIHGAWWTFYPPVACILAAVLAPLLVGHAVKSLPLGGSRAAPISTPKQVGPEVPGAAPPNELSSRTPRDP